MPEKIGTFDAEAFYEALDATREARRKNWKEVAAAAGVSASTLTRMAQGKRPDVDSLAALAAWSGLEVNDFVRTDSRRKAAEPLAVISTLLKSDRNLTPESAEHLDKIIRVAYNRLRDMK
jgi:transcriptional regulator with XRE-family HTH domain